jgi:two-component system, OmpR family, sensor histidine kinase CssS
VVVDGVEYLSIVRPVERLYSEKAGGVNIILYISVGPVTDIANRMVRGIIVAMLISCTVAIIAGLIFAGSLSGPVIRLKNAAMKLGQRDFDTRIDLKTGDELEDLADSINKMASGLKDYDVAQKRFMQNASHELKTPLMSIQGYAEGIRDGVFDDNKEALNVITEETGRLKKLVEQIIYLSKLETMEDFYSFKTESINSVIENSVEKVRSLAYKKGVRLNAMLGKDELLRIDSDKITQALINVLGNCIRHAESEVQVITSKNDSYFNIKVMDDGKGFSEKDHSRVFERFYKGKGGDTGLGLSITKVIVERHGGIVNAENREEGGALFLFTLPVARDI